MFIFHFLGLIPGTKNGIFWYRRKFKKFFFHWNQLKISRKNDFRKNRFEENSFFQLQKNNFLIISFNKKIF